MNFSPNTQCSLCYENLNGSYIVVRCRNDHMDRPFINKLNKMPFSNRTRHSAWSSWQTSKACMSCKNNIEYFESYNKRKLKKWLSRRAPIQVVASKEQFKLSKNVKYIWKNMQHLDGK